MTENQSRAPLEELMVAMDVVDTLRHREKVVARELDSEGRRERLIGRLKEIYAAQGIDVSDGLLMEGVRAMEEDRFSYQPPERSLSTWLASLYVSRGRWLKPLLMLLVLLIVVWSAYYLFFVHPAASRLADLPLLLEKRVEQVRAVSNDASATAQAEALGQSGRLALSSGNSVSAEKALSQLETLLSRLNRNYRLQIVSRPGEKSGVWRIPDINTQARNYYLIVEAIGPDGKVLNLPITSEENGKTREVQRWGLRVDERTFKAVAADKQDDGIIQRQIIGEKKRGMIKPDFTIATPGGAITEW